MKNCNEMVNSLLERREQYETEKKNRRKMLTRTITPLCCMFLAVLLGFGAWKGDVFEYDPGEKELSLHTENANSDDSETGSTSANDVSQLHDNGSVKLVVNQLNAPPFMADVDVQLTHYDKLPYDAWKLIEEEFYTFANISYNDFASLIPEKFSANMTFYALAAKGYKDPEQDNEYRLHDYVFDCQSDDGVQVTIALCNFETPIRDCFIHDENPKVSSVNGIPVTIYGYGSMYMVNFSYKGINYDIETADMDLDQLQELLANIMS